MDSRHPAEIMLYDFGPHVVTCWFKGRKAQITDCNTMNVDLLFYKKTNIQDFFVNPYK